MIYLDNHATTRCDPRVLEAMLPYFGERHGNASSRTHAFGWEAAEAVQAARESVARAIGAAAEEIVFTSGATESINLALLGTAEAVATPGDRFVAQATEHHAVLDVLRQLERQGFEVVILPVDGCGRVAPEDVEAALTPRTRLVAVMAANNEIGTIQPIAEIGRRCRDRGVLLHVDAAQAPGRLAIDVAAWQADLLSLSAHKVYGPKGVGALYFRRRHARLKPRTFGGGHEGGLRSGTLNVPGIVGLGRAMDIAAAQLVDETLRIRALRDRLWDGLRQGLDGIRRNGPEADGLAGNLSVSFDGVDGEALILGLKTVAVSSGSACASASAEPSHVLRAIGLSPHLCLATLRFGVGRFTSEDDVDRAAAAVVARVRDLRTHRRPGRVAAGRREPGGPPAGGPAIGEAPFKPPGP